MTDDDVFRGLADVWIARQEGQLSAYLKYKDLYRLSRAFYIWWAGSLWKWLRLKWIFDICSLEHIRALPTHRDHPTHSHTYWSHRLWLSMITAHCKLEIIAIISSEDSNFETGFFNYNDGLRQPLLMTPCVSRRWPFNDMTRRITRRLSESTKQRHLPAALL